MIKINKKIIKNEIIYWIYILISLLFFNYISFEIEKNRRIIMFVILILIALIFNIVMIVLKKKNIKFYKCFFILALILGITYCFAIPVGTANDEFSHILRIYEISEKYTKFKLNQNSMFPEGFNELLELKNNNQVTYSDFLNKSEKLNLNGKLMDFSEQYNNTKLYSPLQYLPQAIGMSIGNIFSDNIITITIFARIFGLLFWITICTYIIKILPSRKTFFTILMLLPIHICTVSAISGDTVTNAMCMLFIALIYKKMYEKNEISKKEKILLLISATMIALCKIVYLPIVFLILLLGKENFKDKKENILTKVVVILISCIVGVIWFLIGSLILSNSNSNSIEQVKFILQNPIKYIFIIIQTYLNTGSNLIFQSTTGYELLCDSRVLVYTPISYIYSILIIFGLFIKEEEDFVYIDKTKKGFVWLIIFGTILLITTAIYIQWTSMFEIGYSTVLGLQGRYFIPIYMLLIFTIDYFKLDIKKENIFSINIFLQIVIIFLIMQAYM